MAENDINPIIGKSMFYDNYGPAEELQFSIAASNNPRVHAYSISGARRTRDYLNNTNKLAEIENFDQDLSYDEEALQKDLKTYVKACDESDKMRWISYMINDFLGRKNAIKNYHPDKEEVYFQYVKDLIGAKERGEDLNSVKTPTQRQPKLKQIFGENISELGFRNIVDHLNREELVVLKDLLKDGFPSKEVLDAAREKYASKATEIMAPFDYHKREEMFNALMKKYSKGLKEDKEWGETHVKAGQEIKLDFMSDKEKEAFDKMSLNEVTNKYGLEGMWTHKGVAMIAYKINEAIKKDDSQKLSETLAQTLTIVGQRRNCFHVPLEVREFMFETMKECYQQLPQKRPQYNRFSEVDNGFRKIFSTLKPHNDEMEDIVAIAKTVTTQYSTSKETKMHIQKRMKDLQAFSAKVDEVLNPKVDLAKAKEALRGRLEEMHQGNTGGAIVADRHAKAVIQAAESGIHFKGGKAEIDVEAYRNDVHEELQAKREKRNNKAKGLQQNPKNVGRD